MALNRLCTSLFFLNGPAAAVRQLHHRVHHTYRFRPLLVISNSAYKLKLHCRTEPSSRHRFKTHGTQSHNFSTSTPAPTQIQTTEMATHSPTNVKKRRPETYDEALRRLSLLQSNKTIVNLFGDSNTSAPKNKTADLNALAMPEMLAWLSRAGYTPSSLTSSGLRCVHVAGTKGKGSVSTLISSILTEYATSEKVGLYISPHVLSVRERIQLNGEPISREKFTIYFFELWDRLSEAARQAGDLLPSTGSIQPSTTATCPDEGTIEEDEDACDGPQTKPFYFRFLTLLAFHIFVREGVKSAVIECGIGGEYDPTNILEAECVTASVVTQLGIDHVSMLGDTVPKIAWHKGGILKKGVRGFTRDLSQSGEEGQQVMDVLRRRADEKGATLEVVDDGEAESWWDGPVGREIANEARLQGPFRKYNMAIAAKAAREHLVRTGVEVSGDGGLFAREGKLEELPEKFVSGMKKASLRGRCEVLKDGAGIEWFIDGAHTEDSLRGVGEWFAGKVQSSNGDDEVRILLFNQQDRDPGPLVRSLLAGVGASHERPIFTHAIFTRNEEYSPSEGEGPRDLSVQEKARGVFQQVVGSGQEGEGKVEMRTKDAVVPSLELVREIMAQKGKEGKNSGKVLVTGSFHLVGAVLKNVGHVEYRDLV